MANAANGKPGNQPSGWRRVTRTNPCPACGRPDWCGVSADGAVVRCMRVASDQPCRGDAGGWIHRLQDQVRDPRPFPFRLPVRVPAADLAALADRWSRNLTDERLKAFASTLGVTSTSLREFGCGWTGRAFSFPMWSETLQVVGIRLRDPRRGAKWSVRGGHEGVFLPARRAGGRLFIVEGPTDAAAAVVLGFDVLGRPSCTGAVRIAAALARRREVAVVADADVPGQRGAAALADALVRVATAVRVITPPAPHKDLRDWVRAGARRDDIEATISAAAARRLTLQYHHG